MFLPLFVLAVIAYGYLKWFDTYCELKDYRKEVQTAIKDIEEAMPKATHSVKTEVMKILGRIKC